MLFRFVLALALPVSFGIATALAQSGDPIEARQALMKANGAALGTAVRMIRGTNPYDAAAAQQAMKTVEENAAKMEALFPANSTSDKSKALPVIWQNHADFEAHEKRLVDAAKAAGAAAPQGLEAFRTAFAAVGETCNSCHEKFRRN